MSIRRLSLLFALFIPCIVFAQVKYFEVTPAEAPSQIQLYVEHPDCGVLVVYSSLRGLVFDSNMAGIQDQRYLPLESKYVIYLRPIRQMIVVKSPGFREADLWGAGTPKAKEVVGYYTIEEKNTNPGSLSVLLVTFKLSPADATLRIDGQEHDPSKPVMLKPGRYSLEVSKAGFVTESRQIVVSADQVFYDIQLKAQDPVLLTLRSTPSEADVYIDNVNAGKTDLQLFRFPGEYALRISKTGFETIDARISLKASGENSFSYNLSKSTVTLSLNVSPADARVLINNAVEQGRTLELAPGHYKIEALKDGYDPVERRIELVKGRGHTEQISLSQQTGRLILTVKPIDANIRLSDGSSWSGAKMQILPVGSYTVTATMPGHKEHKESFTIAKDKDSTLSLSLEPLSKASDGSPQIAIQTNPGKVPPGMVFVEGGSFMMGSEDGGSNEKPIHQVTLSSFYIGKYEVTQKEWKDVMGSNPSYFKGDNLPVERVSWYEALVYCNKRSLSEGLTPVYSISGSTDPTKWGKVPTSNNSKWNNVSCNWKAEGYRLPTEAEWEYAARGGKHSKGYIYSGSNDIKSVAWYSSNSGKKTQKVGTMSANELGIYDMSGNVWEWCWDWYGSYSSSPSSNPTGSASGLIRVLRGGGWYSNVAGCRVADRYNDNPDGSNYYGGVRVSRAIK